MAVLGKLTLIIGAGIVGSILTKEGGSPSITNIFSGAFKFVTKHLQQDKDSSQSTSKPQNDTLLAQINNLRQELQLLASSRSVTIVTGGTSGSGSYHVTTIIAVGFVGCGYVWWKGWKFPDIMPVTRRGLSDARAAVGKQLEKVSSSITSAKQQLSSRINHVDNNLDECKEVTVATKEEVSRLHGGLHEFQMDFKSVHDTVQTLETKLGRIEGIQDVETQGVYHLCQYVQRLQQSRNAELLQDLPSRSSQAIELPQAVPVTRAPSLPPLALEPPPSSSSSTSSSTRILHSTSMSASGLKELQVLGISSVLRSGSTSPVSPDVLVRTPRREESSTDVASGSSRFGWKLPGVGFLTRTKSSS